MATKLGTAFVDVQPDFSAFDRLVAKKLGSSFADAGEQSGRDFSKGFDRNTSGVLVPISRALRNVGTDADNAGTKAKDFGKVTAKAAGEATAAVKKISKEIASVPALDASAFDLSRAGRIDLQVAGAKAEVQGLKGEIATLVAAPKTVTFDGDVAKLLAKLDQAEAKVARLESKRVEIKADVDRTLPSTLNSITSSVTGLFASLGAGGGGGLGGATARISAGFISFGATAAPLAAVLAGLAVVIGVALVGALVALASSLALAAAGAAALGVAMGGVLGAGLALLIPVAIRVGKIFESLKADNAATDALGRSSAAGSQAAAAAAKQQEAAARGLTDANRSLSEASAAVGAAAKAAYREMADAAENASDAIRNVETSQISLDRAQISTERARLELEQFRNELGATGDAFGAAFDKFTDVAVDTSGLRAAISDANDASGSKLNATQELDLRDKILAVREARQREKDAVDGVSDATRAASRAQEIDNTFKRQGIAASQSYQGALKAQAAAQRGVANAQRAVADANAAAAAGGAGVAAQEKATQLAGKLTDAEVKLKETLVDVGKALRGAFTPATDAVISGMTTALGRIPAIVNPLRGAFTRLGEAWRDAIKTFSGDLIKTDNVNKMRAFTDGAAKLAGPVTRGISSLLDILTDIARAALPFLISGTKTVADKLKEWSNETANTKKLSGTIGGIVGHLKTWLGVAGALGRTFVAFIRSAAGPGQGLAQNIKDLADRTTRWLSSDAGRAELKEFFTDSIAFSKEFLKVVGQLTIAIARFAKNSAPVLTPVFDALSKIIGLLDKLKLLQSPLTSIKELVTAGSISGVEQAKRAVDALSKAQDGLADAQDRLTTAQRGLTAAQRDGRRELSDLAAASRGAALTKRGADLDLKDARKELATLKAQGAGADELARASLNVAEAKQRVRDATREAARSHDDNERAQRLGVKGTDAYRSATDELREAMIDVASELRKVVDAQRDVANPPEPNLSIWDRIKLGATRVRDFIRDNWPKLTGILANPIGIAVVGIVASFDTIKRKAGEALWVIIRLVDGLAGAWSTMLTAISKVPGFGWAKAGAKAIDGARAKLRGLSDELLKVPEKKTLRLHVALTPEAKKALAALNKLGNSVGGPQGDGRIGRAAGGIIPGFGTADTVPLWGTPGEFMTRRAIVQHIGPTVFADINAGRLDPRYGYEVGQRPSVSTQPVKGNHYASGGVIGAVTGRSSQIIEHHGTFPITVAGGGPPDPVDLIVKAARTLEARAGGLPRQD